MDMMSNDIAKLSEALAKFQGSIGSIPKKRKPRLS